ncbi:hypothetical protein PQR75_26395 [Paraburkholderia fungorum]|uniref:hypothetical protein n=1 Tax=Paraburkholderia fungorum TaxID=134537 RepID=UPI0038B83D77
MANDDNLVKTSLRLPRQLHVEIDKAADAAGISTNAEMLLRLARDPHVDTAAQVLEHIKRTEGHAVDAMARQIKALWGALDRANSTLEHVATAMAQVPPDGSAAALKREVEFARELINALGAHR